MWPVREKKPRKGGSSTMANKLVKRGATGKIIDRASSTKGKQKPMPSALAKFFRPIGGTGGTA